jgi:hypothetical protein
MGCCAGGCLTFFVIGFLGLAALVGVSWYLARKAIVEFTATQPVEIALQMPSDAEFSAADAKLNQLRTALRGKQHATITFTADELNAIVARHPDFSPRNGKMRFAIANSVATVEMSMPLAMLELPGLRQRWFNGSANFGFIYADEGFRFDANWLEANGHRLTGVFVRSFAGSFSRSFSRSFNKGIEKNGASDFWRNVKTMTLDEDKLVIITRGE